MDNLKVLAQAKNIELAGYNFYTQVAASARDSKIQEMFVSLANDEKHHKNYLERLEKSLEDQQKWIEIPELDAIEFVEDKKPVFPDGLEPPEKLSQDSADEDVLLFALGAEVRSYDIYIEIASKVEDPLAKKIFQKLAAFELGHFEMIMLRLDSVFSYPK
jgi:rubrerythrin